MKSIDSAKGMMGGLTDKATKPPAKPLSGTLGQTYRLRCLRLIAHGSSRNSLADRTASFHRDARNRRTD